MSFNSIVAASEGFWPFQEASGSIAEDFSGNGRDGTIIGATPNATGPNGWLQKAYDFDGVDDKVDLHGQWIPDGDYTILAWFSADSQSSGGSALRPIIIQEADSLDGLATELSMWRSGSGRDGYLRAREGDGSSILVETAYDDGVWRIASTTRSDNIELFVNGVSKGTATIGTYIRKRNTTVGGSYEFLNRHFNGRIAGVLILSEENFSADYPELEDGPEPRYVSGVDLQAAGTFDVGTWALPAPFASGSNGTISADWVIANAAGSVIDSGSLADIDSDSTDTADISSESGNTVYLLARASNTGGYDVGDKSTRTSGYGSADDGYYEIANVVAAGGGGSDTGAAAIQHYYRHLLAGV